MESGGPTHVGQQFHRQWRRVHDTASCCTPAFRHRPWRIRSSGMAEERRQQHSLRNENKLNLGRPPQGGLFFLRSWIATKVVRCPLLALSGHRLVRRTCLLLTQSGHRLRRTALTHRTALPISKRIWVPLRRVQKLVVDPDRLEVCHSLVGGATLWSAPCGIFYRQYF